MTLNLDLDLIAYPTQTDDVNLFGFKWSADEDFCTLSMDPTNDPCEQDAALAARIERTCSIFDPVRNGGKHRGAVA